jgi:hypothetical protein
MNITGRSKSWYVHYGVIKKLLWILQGDQKLVWILQGDQKVGMNITGWSKSWYEYYSAIKKLVWILQVDKKLVWILQGDQKVAMNITGWSKSWYEYYRAIKKLVWILQNDQKVGMNISWLSKSWYVYFQCYVVMTHVITGSFFSLLFSSLISSSPFPVATLGQGTRWRSYLRHYATNRQVAGSISAGVNGNFHWHNPSGRTMALASTQPLTENSSKEISLRVKAAGA